MPQYLNAFDPKKSVRENVMTEILASGAFLNDEPQTLKTIRLVEKCVPCGQPENSKKGIYEITDHFYRFWYRFVFSNKNYYSMLGVEKACDEIMDEINDYMGTVFEHICTQYLIRQAQAFPELKERYLFFISKSGFTEPVLKRAKEEGAQLFTLADLL